MAEIGEIVEGKVVNIMPFGAFVEIEKGKSGLVHISEVASDYVKDINDYLKVGDKVKVKVLSIDPAGKISLSIKKAAAPTKEKNTQSTNQKAKIRPASVELFTRSNNDMSFEDKLSRFKSDSDEKMQALKRSMDGKRSGGYKR